MHLIAGVANTAPTFATGTTVTNQVVNWKNSLTYQLPAYQDAEGNPVVTTTVKSGTT